MVKKKQRKRQVQKAKQAQQRKKTLPVSRLTDKDVQAYRDEMQRVIDYANRQVNTLHNQGLTTIELARFEDLHSTDIFDISNITNVNELRAYMSEVRVILPGIAPQSKKALLETAMMEAAEYRGQFGGQYNEPVKGFENIASPRRYNINDVIDNEGNIIRRAIDPAIASRAFRAYRNLEKEYAPVIGRQGQAGVYGSENLIIAIYDMEARGGDGQEYGKDLLEAWLSEINSELYGTNISLDEATAMVAYWEDYINRRDF